MSSGAERHQVVIDFTSLNRAMDGTIVIKVTSSGKPVKTEGLGIVCPAAE